MYLTVIIPSLTEKELIRKIKNEIIDKDELITLKVSSRNIKEILDNLIINSKNDNILIINPKDRSTRNVNYLDSLRIEDIFISNKNANQPINLNSSIKFNKNSFFPSNSANIKNLYSYMVDLNRNLNKELNETDLKKLIEEEQTTKFKEMKVESIKTDKTPKKRKINKKPKILFLCDVVGWAWWIKSNFLKKYLENDFEIDLINLIGKDKGNVNPNLYDLYFTFGYSYVGYLRKVDFNKRITGVTAHRGKKIINSLKQAPWIHANSMLLYNEYKGIGKKTFYVPNGVDESLFTPNPIKDIFSRKEIHIGHVGKKAKLKQQKTVIEPVIEKLGKDYKYIYHYNDYTKKIPHTEMPKLYKDMDLFIVASLEEGTPNGALEAMSSGVPVISNKIGNMPEIIHNGFNGYIIENPTIENYVNLIKSLEKDHIKEMGINARTSIENGWTWKHKAENYRNMFWEILGK